MAVFNCSTNIINVMTVGRFKAVRGVRHDSKTFCDAMKIETSSYKIKRDLLSDYSKQKTFTVTFIPPMFTDCSTDFVVSLIRVTKLPALPRSEEINPTPGACGGSAEMKIIFKVDKAGGT